MIDRKNSKDALGDRQKVYERKESDERFIPNLPVYVRLDGRGFSKFTKGMKRPYDSRMSQLMIDTTKFLVKEFQPLVGFCQSDEISLVFKNDYYTPMIFDGRKDKIKSILAAATTSYFGLNAKDLFPEKNIGVTIFPQFDCRAHNVPSWVEASNALLWRNNDCIKNSISMLAQHHFSHKALQGKNQKAQLIMLEGIGEIWGNYPRFFKEGTFCKSETYFKASPVPEGGFKKGELQVVSSLNVMRTRIGELDIAPLSQYSLEERLVMMFGDTE